MASINNVRASSNYFRKRGLKNDNNNFANQAQSKKQRKSAVSFQDQENANSMEISPSQSNVHLKQEHIVDTTHSQKENVGITTHVDVKQETMHKDMTQRTVLQETINIQKRPDVASSKSHIPKPVVHHKHKVKVTPGAAKKSKKNRVRTTYHVHIPHLDSYQVHVNDSLPMDVDPALKIRDVQSKPSLVTFNTDLFCCPEYQRDIYLYMMTVERKSIVPPDFLNLNEGVTPNMRAILNDWLIQVQSHQEMSQQTLHLTIIMVDKILNKLKMKLSVLQLLGVSCFLLAAKFNERFPPEISILCHLTDGTYTPNEVLQMEQLILNELAFDMNLSEPTAFLDFFLEIEKEEKEVCNLAKYILDLTLVSTDFVSILPSQLAASALFLSKKVLGCSNAWSVDLTYYTMYSEKEIKPCVQGLAKLLMGATTSKLQGAYNKFNSMRSFGAISSHPSVIDIDILKQAAGI